jgi:hypothetical protein
MGLVAHFLAPAHCSFTSPRHLGFAQQEARFYGLFRCSRSPKIELEKTRMSGVDKAGRRGLYTPNTARRRFGVMARLRSSSLIVVVETPIRLGGQVSATFHLWKGGASVPGCLTGESEERETWTAESLRAASSIERTRPDETSAVLRFRSTPWPRKRTEWDLVKREVTSRYQSSHPT